jgi:hypothetical protein
MANDNQPDEEATTEGEPQPAPEDEFEYYKPRPNLQVWLILGGIAFVVAVAVLFIYQAGDKKTILTMQPLEPAAFGAQAGAGAGRGQGCTQPGGACNVEPAAWGHAGCTHPGGGCGHHDGLGPGGGHRGAHGGGGGVNCPTGGQAAPSPKPAATTVTPAGFDLPWMPSPATNLAAQALQAAAVGPATNATAQPAHCPRCGANAMPLCSRCNAMMLPLGDSLFYCPACGAVGLPPCPYCGARMTSVNAPPTSPPLATLGAANAQPPSATLQPVWGRTEISGGQFLCPYCNATGLPNWDAAGNPICPSCHRPMSIRAMQSPP